MYSRLLFPTDGSDAAAAMFDYVLDVAATHDATVHVLNVADTNQDSLTRIGGEVVDVLEGEGERVVDEATARAADRGVDTVAEVLQGDPAPTIVDYADVHDIDLVAMPTHGRRGLSRLLLGSVTERVVSTVDAPVVVATPDDDDVARFAYPPRTILVPLDGSRAASLALDSAAELAADIGASVHLLHVVETGRIGSEMRSLLSVDDLESRAGDLLAEAEATATAAGVETVTTAVRDGHAHEEIRSAATEHDVDLVAMGVHGTTGFSHSVLGGVVSKTLRVASVPVLLRRDAGADASR